MSDQRVKLKPIGKPAAKLFLLSRPRYIRMGEKLFRRTGERDYAEWPVDMNGWEKLVESRDCVYVDDAEVVEVER